MLKTLGLATALFILFVQSSLAGSPISGAKDGVAIQGFDTVAYFTEGKAVKGVVSLFRWKLEGAVPVVVVIQ